MSVAALFGNTKLGILNDSCKNKTKLWLFTKRIIDVGVIFYFYKVLPSERQGNCPDEDDVCLTYTADRGNGRVAKRDAHNFVVSDLETPVVRGSLLSTPFADGVSWSYPMRCLENTPKAWDMLSVAYWLLIRK